MSCLQASLMLSSSLAACDHTAARRRRVDKQRLCKATSDLCWAHSSVPALECWPRSLVRAALPVQAAPLWHNCEYLFIFVVEITGLITVIAMVLQSSRRSPDHPWLALTVARASPTATS